MSDVTVLDIAVESSNRHLNTKPMEKKVHYHFEISASRARLHASEKTVKRLEEELKSSKSREDSLQNDLVG